MNSKNLLKRVAQGVKARISRIFYSFVRNGIPQPSMAYEEDTDAEEDSEVEVHYTSDEQLHLQRNPHRKEGTDALHQ